MVLTLNIYGVSAYSIQCFCFIPINQSHASAVVFVLCVFVVVVVVICRLCHASFVRSFLGMVRLSMVLQYFEDDLKAVS